MERREDAGAIDTHLVWISSATSLVHLATLFRRPIEVSGSSMTSDLQENADPQSEGLVSP